MSIPSDSCKNTVESYSHVMAHRLNITAQREMLRALASSTSNVDPAYLQLEKKVAAGTATEADAETVEKTIRLSAGSDASYIKVKKFEGEITAWVIQYGVPGWSNDGCAQDWKKLACFCYGAAIAYLGGTSAFNTYLSFFQVQNDNVNMLLCPPQVQGDAFYAIPLSTSSTPPLPPPPDPVKPDPPKPTPGTDPVDVKEEEKTSWLPVVGVGIGALLLVILATRD